MTPDDVDFPLPAELIARHPTAIRSASRLLSVTTKALDIDAFARLPALLEPGDLLIFNDTRVIRARLYGRKATGGKIELLLERLTGTHSVTAQIKASHAPKPGSSLELISSIGEVITTATVVARDGRFFQLQFESPVAEVAQVAGEMPLPPYLERDATADDEMRYQTIYARHPGAVAAPTAGLHFDQAVFDALAARGVAHAFVTLHVAAGTFAPLSDTQLKKNALHAEQFEINAACCEAIARTRAKGGRVVAVGTTSLRALESAALLGAGHLQPTTADTTLFIRPGFEFQVVDGLITNFHLPRSSLMMLVAAFVGHQRVMDAYAYAVAARMRFFSYGDAMLHLRMRRERGVGADHAV
ncbi:MAG: tRNA preQ1(34) S-adenosylmethionine ribosyltransferase-isomerase QueA [Pseudomonadota bacterium]